MKCGECGGGVVIWKQIRIGCANDRDNGTCSNKPTIRQVHLGAAVLDGLQHHLMDPELTEVFCKEPTEHTNSLGDGCDSVTQWHACRTRQDRARD